MQFKNITMTSRTPYVESGSIQPRADASLQPDGIVNGLKTNAHIPQSFHTRDHLISPQFPHFGRLLPPHPWLTVSAVTAAPYPPHPPLVLALGAGAGVGTAAAAAAASQG